MSFHGRRPRSSLKSAVSMSRPLTYLEAPMIEGALDKVSNDPLFPLNFEELKSLAKTLFRSSLPASITSVSVTINSLVCLMFLGEVDDPRMLAGASLGSTWGNAFGVGVIISINQGYNVLASQTYGAKLFRKFGILYQRNLFVLGIMMIPLVIFLWFSASILHAVGFEEQVSQSAGVYIRYTIPSIMGIAVMDCTKSFLMAQNEFNVQSVVQSVTAVLNFFWCYLLVDKFKLSLIGSAIAKSITDVTSAIILVLYIKYSGKFKRTWIPWNKECMEGWIPYLKITSVIGANLYVEWIAYEASILVAGALHDDYIIGAHGLALSLQIVVFTIPLGNSYAMQTYIGNAAGEGSKNKVLKIACVGLFLNFIESTINTLVFLLFAEEIANFFTQEPKTVEILKNMLIIYALAHHADTYANHLGGILKTIGSERDVLMRFIFSYVVVGLPAEWIFGVSLKYSYFGIWLAMIASMYLMVTLMTTKVMKFDWELAINNIQLMLKEEEQNMNLCLELI